MSGGMTSQLQPATFPSPPPARRLPAAAVSLRAAQRRLLLEALDGVLGTASRDALAMLLASDEFQALDLTSQRGLLNTFRRRAPFAPTPLDRTERRRMADDAIAAHAQRMLLLVRGAKLQGARTPVERWDVIRAMYARLRR
jgi:hypothetical protein